MYDGYTSSSAGPSSPSPLGTGAFELPKIPSPGDEAATQQFYRDVVNHLQTISHRTSAPPSPVPTQMSFLGSAGLPFLNADSPQFEDAEDDESEMGSPMMYPGSEYDTHSPVLASSPNPNGGGGNKAPPLVRPRMAGNRSSTRGDPSNSSGIERANSRASSSGSAYTSVVGPSTANRPISYENKENMRFVRGTMAGGMVPPPIAARPGQMVDKRATLGLAIQQSGVPTFELDGAGGGRRNLSPASAAAGGGIKMKKKKGESIFYSFCSAQGGTGADLDSSVFFFVVAFSPASPAMSMSESSSPAVKQSWFANLFNWKQLVRLSSRSSS